MDHYTHYDSRKIRRLKDCLSSVANNGNKMSTVDIERWFNLNTDSAGQLAGHLASLGVISKIGVGENKRYLYSVDSSKLETQIIDVRTDIPNKVLAREVLYQPTDAVCAALKDNKMYILQKTPEMLLYSDIEQNTMTNEILVDCIECAIHENVKKVYRKIIKNLGFDYSSHSGEDKLVKDIKKHALEKQCSLKDLRNTILHSIEPYPQKPYLSIYLSILLKKEHYAEPTGYKPLKKKTHTPGIMCKTVARNDVLVAELETTDYGETHILNVSKMNSGNLNGELTNALIYPVSNEDAIHLLRLAEFEKPPHYLNGPLKHINSLNYII